MDLGITGRVAFVTGAGRGIGAEICLALAAEGVRIAVNDLFQDRADETAGLIRKSGGQAIGVAADGPDLPAGAAGPPASRLTPPPSGRCRPPGRAPSPSSAPSTSW